MNEMNPGFGYGGLGSNLRQFHLRRDDLPVITVKRGGIKYPTPKGTAMPSLNHQLTALKEQQESLARQVVLLERKIKASRPAAPPLNQSMWTIDVRFNPGGTLYTYLILRHGRAFYTTGTGEDKKFPSWDALLDWLGGMASHSALIPLRTDYEMKCPLEGRRS
jgi:hypothetical protein